MQDKITSVDVYQVLKAPLINQTKLDRSSSELYDIAGQFLANTPVDKTRETYARELAFFISWYGRDSIITDVKFEDLLKYKVLLENNYSAATVMKKIAALKSFFRFAKRIKVIDNNPAEELRVKGPVKNRIPTHLTVEEMKRLIKMPDRRTMLGKRDAAHDWDQVKGVTRRQAVECKMWAEELIIRDLLDRSDKSKGVALTVHDSPQGAVITTNFNDNSVA